MTTNANTFNVSSEVKKALIDYKNLLLKWNKTVNLISKNSEKEIWERHICDSLQLTKYINFSDTIIDFGSGAGLPGIILSIAGVKNMLLIEANKKKISF